MRGVQGVGKLPGDRDRLVQRERSARDALGERLPLDQLHHERANAVRFFDLVDLRDVGVIEREPR